ncbi:hypothetical protein KY363_01990 [Candidatus Woesearchaeota archaeon]|nr:hypothetical protein [Candidatus Woesearchaeota archaeon]
MTEQITIKLNKKMFRPVIEKLKEFAGTGMFDSDSDIAGKALFYTLRATCKKHEKLNKTSFDIITETTGLTKPEALLEFLNDYYKFKKNGLTGCEKKNGKNGKRH